MSYGKETIFRSKQTIWLVVQAISSTLTNTEVYLSPKSEKDINNFLLHAGPTRNTLPFRHKYETYNLVLSFFILTEMIKLRSMQNSEQTTSEIIKLCPLDPADGTECESCA